MSITTQSDTLSAISQARRLSEVYLAAAEAILASIHHIVTDEPCYLLKQRQHAA
ncbi:hypothetical protein FHS40_008702 [Streptomyces spectabilis]|uniref:Uncharacterized protein n=1 Tax=Streptomyces spectabilis TaxID=68270 RepID=A0A7W8EZU9_STRST|nr:hypothetical protein [Streptomyces spectabilis]